MGGNRVIVYLDEETARMLAAAKKELEETEEHVGAEAESTSALLTLLIRFALVSFSKLQGTPAGRLARMREFNREHWRSRFRRSA